MDEIDKKILQMIQRNGKISIKNIAKKLNIPVTTVHFRLKKLEKTGVIKEYRAILDPKKVDKPILAFILVGFDPTQKIPQEEVAKIISEFKDVQEVHIITGEWDILVKIRGKNIEEISEMILKKIREVRGVEKTYSLIVLKSIKETTELSV